MNFEQVRDSLENWGPENFVLGHIAYNGNYCPTVKLPYLGEQTATVRNVTVEQESFNFDVKPPVQNMQTGRFDIVITGVPGVTLVFEQFWYKLTDDKFVPEHLTTE